MYWICQVQQSFRFKFFACWRFGFDLDPLHCKTGSIHEITGLHPFPAPCRCSLFLKYFFAFHGFIYWRNTKKWDERGRWHAAGQTRILDRCSNWSGTTPNGLSGTPQTQHYNCTSNKSWPNLVWKLFKTGTKCATVKGLISATGCFSTEPGMQGWGTQYTKAVKYHENTTLPLTVPFCCLSLELNGWVFIHLAKLFATNELLDWETFIKCHWVNEWELLMTSRSVETPEAETVQNSYTSVSSVLLDSQTSGLYSSQCSIPCTTVIWHFHNITLTHFTTILWKVKLK